MRGQYRKKFYFPSWWVANDWRIIPLESGLGVRVRFCQFTKGLRSGCTLFRDDATPEVRLSAYTWGLQIFGPYDADDEPCSVSYLSHDFFFSQVRPTLPAADLVAKLFAERVTDVDVLFYITRDVTFHMNSGAFYLLVPTCVSSDVRATVTLHPMWAYVHDTYRVFHQQPESAERTSL